MALTSLILCTLIYPRFMFKMLISFRVLFELIKLHISFSLSAPTKLPDRSNTSNVVFFDRLRHKAINPSNPMLCYDTFNSMIEVFERIMSAKIMASEFP